MHSRTNRPALFGGIRLALALFPLALGACALAWSEPDAGQSLADTSWIQPGVTTRKDVLSRLGEPRSTLQFPTDEMFHYSPTPKDAPFSHSSAVPYLTPTPFGYATVTPSVQPPNPSGDPSGSSGSTSREPSLWIRFDGRGIVQEFGFDAPPK